MKHFFIFTACTVYSLKMVLALSIFMFTLLIVGLPVAFFLLRWKYTSEKQKNRNDKLKVAFFHPYCNAGGGGEKVLWVALQALQEQYPLAEFYIYTGDIEANPLEILFKVEKTLNVNISKNIRFIYVHRRKWIEAHMYPYFTLLGQSLGSVYLGFEALSKCNPDIFIDTTGCSFTLPLFKYIGGCKTGCYVHYPTITTDMLKRVQNRTAMYNNRPIIARSPVLSMGKLTYYRIFAWMYSWAGQCSDSTIVNSTFTQRHLNTLWNRPIQLVYPPCDVEHLKRIPRGKTQLDKIRILSLAQFRPEKDHPLQLQALYELREIISEELFSNITLVLCGSCRNSDDAIRVKDLKDLSKHLSLENNVEFKVNITYDELLSEFEKAYIGIHTMLDEHFGIGVVELMAAGLITIAHKSGGPLLDIIESSEGSRLGFLAITADEYAHTIRRILYLSEDEVNSIRERARASVDRFSTPKFKEEFLRVIEPLFK
ncbi:GDP-Man:Man(3)GlcNAc(2)-PP-Dol alpha-1,2-mannosyltransferase [Agrilus planipennis]|uniref:GDP-Man:Man(3)GlcNAc(2)-PP-Dol alpha-1,2-mannosyltransferase n=1 Tax=Agrilus planipennis TaxID=224129 RepID=A0A1W4WXL8_AGRPL|nr:GDP-Man:Man(3)GlcNAc(2)-PP-Dol alpha-1,2-mannosyltransferase [Agrilus planipennis]